MASILVLATLHDLSDRETAEAARCDLRWKVATGMALGDPGFDASTLMYWRRLAASGRPHRISEAVRRVIEQTGIVRGRTKRAVDSTILPFAATVTQSWATAIPSRSRREPAGVGWPAEARTCWCSPRPNRTATPHFW